jgi:hypothetical protein
LIDANFVKVVSKVKNLVFVLNQRRMVTDHFRKVCQEAAHTLFEVRRRLVLSLILPHVVYGNIVFLLLLITNRRRGLKLHSRLVFIIRLDHVSHLKSVTGNLLVDHSRIQLLSFL